ncbi:hypothetical protein C361_06893 [Cryptococcus neoformans Tu259-1]|uniref:Uncharacterized protein n=1 Tax=Cryptococcus neoformans Tu259-1 TaxID=1230072 RepID=A0A854Q4L5_CRYNE|nr:hypothetical protein C361_06893 [Cryptococcus neoformans var. grubii Tu259-1]
MAIFYLAEQSEALAFEK